MSMLTAQCDELRDKAMLFEGYNNGEISRMLRGAADTIETLRERAQAATLGERRDPTKDWLLSVCNQATQDYVAELERKLEVVTFGSGECEWVLEHSGTLYDKWRCSECKFLFVEPRCDQGYTDLVPNYCPNCGAKVIDTRGDNG